MIAQCSGISGCAPREVSGRSKKSRGPPARQQAVHDIEVRSDELRDESNGRLVEVAVRHAVQEGPHANEDSTRKLDSERRNTVTPTGQGGSPDGEEQRDHEECEGGSLLRCTSELLVVFGYLRGLGGALGQARVAPILPLGAACRRERRLLLLQGQGRKGGAVRIFGPCSRPVSLQDNEKLNGRRALLVLGIPSLRHRADRAWCRCSRIDLFPRPAGEEPAEDVPAEKSLQALGASLPCKKGPCSVIRVVRPARSRAASRRWADVEGALTSFAFFPCFALQAKVAAPEPPKLSIAQTLALQHLGRHRLRKTMKDKGVS